MKKISVLFSASLIAAVIFCLFTVSFHADLSLAAFPVAFIYTAVLFVTGYINLLKKNDPAMIPVVRKLLQYEPFVLLAAFIFRRAGAEGTAYWYDVIAVLAWVAVMVISFFLLYHLDDKRVYAYQNSWKEYHDAQKKTVRKGMLFIAAEAVDWIDALIQAVCMVLLIQIFIVQLYQIPSESMVPEFLINDRVIVFKTISGPKFPLSEVGIPEMRNYKRGNIVVFRNPHYPMDRKSEIKTFVSQLVYMLTFTKVNLNVDQEGDAKADPLVKRVTGVPGEQLMLQDGILYARTKDDAQFKPVETEKNWAAWDLNTLSSDLKSRVRQLPVSAEQYRMMVDCEEQRRGLDMGDVRDECEKLASEFVQLSGQSVKSSADVSGLFTKGDMFEYLLFRDNEAVTRKLLTASGGAKWFNAFMTAWTAKVPAVNGPVAGDDLYADANFKLNLMIKLTLGELIVRNAELLKSGTSAALWNSDAVRIKYMEKAEMLHNYIMLLDRRNMPIFPANDAQGNHQYIPANCYFMMGDNRFNSLDMRHSYDETLTALTPLDDYSTTYYSNMAPQYVNRRLILGTTAFRFWPLNRIGKL